MFCVSLYGRVLVLGCIFVTSIYAATCPEGTFISRSSVSGCQLCPNGTFSDSKNSTKCRKCDECRGIHNRVTTACTTTSNTKCTCEPGYYYNVFLICLKCHPCKKGKGVIQNCTSVSNTVCGFCEKNKTYSDTKDFSACKKCTKCPKGDWVEQQCTRRSDTVCKTEKDKNDSKRTRIVDRGRSGITEKTTKATSLTDKKSTSTRSPTHHSTSMPNSTNTKIHQVDLPSDPESQMDPASAESNDKAYIIALSVLSGFALVVFLITIALMYRKKRSRNLPMPRDKEKAEEPPTPSSEVTGAQENPYSSLQLIGTRQEKMLRDAPYTLISDLANHLNPGSRWKDLGGRLHFNNTQISNFALVQNNATQAMLEEWGQRDCATVVALRNILHSMKWSREEKICAAYV